MLPNFVHPHDATHYRPAMGAFDGEAPPPRPPRQRLRALLRIAMGALRQVQARAAASSRR